MIRWEYICDGQLDEGVPFKITSHNGEKDVTEKRCFAGGDRIIFTANNSRLGVLNGTMGQIEDIHGNVFTVRTDSGEQVTFDMEQYNSIDYSYTVANYNEKVYNTSLRVSFKELLTNQDNYSTFLISSIHDVSGFCNRLANVPKFVLPL